MIDRALLDDFMTRFYGYGSWKAPLWFVGMEEGGGKTPEELALRLQAWDGKSELSDLKEYHSELGGTNWFSSRPRIQSTWGKLIRVALAVEGRDVNREAVRSYQRDELGRSEGRTALIELLPLPSPSTTDWPYAKLPEPLDSRASYLEAMVPRRTARIRERLKSEKPAVVLFYGLRYRAHWEDIIEGAFRQQDERRFLTATSATTRFILAPHPAAQGVANADYDAIAEWLA